MAKKKTPAVRTKRPTKKNVSASTKTQRKTTRSGIRKPTTNGNHNHAPVRPGPIEMVDPEVIRKIKSPLSARELREYRELLVNKRREILGDMKSMSHEALNGDAANLSHMPIHMADVGSDHYEQELTLGLVESERRLLHEIDEALERIADGTYGVCQATGKPIGKPRLQAKPWAKYGIEAAREMERHTPRW